MHIKEFTLPSIVTLALLGIGGTHPANAQQQICAPASQATTDDGFVLSTDPFNYAGPSRFQNIYSSTEFAGFTTPLLITQLAFRPAASQASAFSDTQNVTIDLSSTSQSITGLNATYADTVGSNNTVVYNGPLTLSTASQQAQEERNYSTY